MTHLHADYLADDILSCGFKGHLGIANRQLVLGSELAS